MPQLSPTTWTAHNNNNNNMLSPVLSDAANPPTNKTPRAVLTASLRGPAPRCCAAPLHRVASLDYRRRGRSDDGPAEGRVREAGPKPSPLLGAGESGTRAGEIAGEHRHHSCTEPRLAEYCTVHTSGLQNIPEKYTCYLWHVAGNFTPAVFFSRRYVVCLFIAAFYLMQKSAQFI